MSVATVWGARPDEVARRYACDDLATGRVDLAIDGDGLATHRDHVATDGDDLGTDHDGFATGRDDVAADRDGYGAGRPGRLVRAVDVAAPVSTAFAWLCQLRVAPYSYDLLDNGGRRSPRTRTVRPQDLVPGTTMMRIFELVAAEPDEHLTLRIVEPRALRAFGPVVVTYAVHPDGPGRSRYVVVLRVGSPTGGRADAVRRELLAWGDLVMMRKQLRTLAALAGREALSGVRAPR